MHDDPLITYLPDAPATHADRRSAATNKRTVDRATGTLETADAARARYAYLGLQTTSYFHERDHGAAARPAPIPAENTPDPRYPAGAADD
jgi:hypothetical protein